MKRATVKIKILVSDNLLYCSCRCPALLSHPDWCAAFGVQLAVTRDDVEHRCHRCAQCHADAEVGP
jgi:hypothetical protein